VRPFLAAVVVLLAACGGSQGADPAATGPTEPPATTTAVSTATTVPATTITEPTGLVGEELLACMVGSWTLDTEAFEAELQFREDPSELSISIDVLAGRGDLDIRADYTFMLSYEELTIRFHSLQVTGPNTDTEMVTAGEVTAVFELEGDVFLAGEIDGQALNIRGWWPDENREIPRRIHPGAIAMGTEVIPMYIPAEITADCGEDRLVINDVIHDPLTEDGPSTIWVRYQDG
jgi:hypothetical protein